MITDFNTYYLNEASDSFNKFADDFNNKLDKPCYVNNLPFYSKQTIKKIANTLRIPESFQEEFSMLYYMYQMDPTYGGNLSVKYGDPKLKDKVKGYVKRLIDKKLKDDAYYLDLYQYFEPHMKDDDGAWKGVMIQMMAFLCRTISNIIDKIDKADLNKLNEIALKLTLFQLYLPFEKLEKPEWLTRGGKGGMWGLKTE